MNHWGYKFLLQHQMYFRRQSLLKLLVLANQQLVNFYMESMGRRNQYLSHFDFVFYQSKLHQEPQLNRQKKKR
ncbi:MAG: hypothetical protein US63_C0036G0009 [Candidatus Moranbacteria bacterium GW2011_GWC2_37_8]|nr:MAG: hypothetical protein US63_C0036G0009 [Candidatus Moranbacteria bacterium GW2011_GWC2_37_8]